jgi:hypothetical protein
MKMTIWHNFSFKESKTLAGAVPSSWNVLPSSFTELVSFLFRA